MAPASARGAALLDILPALALAALVSATTIPVVAGTLEHERAWLGANFVAARVVHAQLEVFLVQALLEREGELSFAFSFLDTRSDATDGGVIVLRGRREHWSFDTLRTYRMPSVVRAVHDVGRGAIVVTLVCAYFAAWEATGSLVVAERRIPLRTAASSVGGYSGSV